MPKINRYQDINEIGSEAKKDFVDRHSPFIHCEAEAKAGVPFAVTIKMGEEYQHPDDFDHYISSISLFDKETKLAEMNYLAGAQGGQDKKANATVTFHVVLSKNAKLVAQAYCTKHGIWESDPKEIKVEG